MPPRSVPTEAGPATLEASLSFEAPYLIEKLVNDHVCDNEDEARALFREVKRYLFLNRADQSKLWEMHSLRVDEVWHQFILFTRQYADFCTRYYGTYSPHSPSNAPVSAKNSARQKQVATFKEFHAYYEKVFGEPLPDHWYDERNVCLHSRVLDARIGKLLLKEEGGKVELVDGAGEVVFAVNSWPRRRSRSLRIRERSTFVSCREILTTTRRSRSSLRWSSTRCFAWRLERANPASG